MVSSPKDDFGKNTTTKVAKNHYISNSYPENLMPIDAEYFTAYFSRFGRIRKHFNPHGLASIPLS